MHVMKNFFLTSVVALILSNVLLYSQAHVAHAEYELDQADSEDFTTFDTSLVARKKKHRESHSTCDLRPGPTGVAGLLNFAAFEWSVSPHTTPHSLRQHQPIPFLRQRALEGKAIEASYPYDGITLAKGEYQISVGLANNGGPSGPAKDLQIELYVNHQRVYTWPGIDGKKNNAAAFVSFTTIIKTEGTSSFLQVISGSEVIYDETESGGVVAYLNITKLDPDVPSCQTRQFE